MADTSTRFIRLPAESISLCGESVGIQVNQEIEELLNEDVSYRIRKIAHVRGNTLVIRTCASS